MNERTDAGALVEQGRLLGRRYRADSLLGRGGMGEVWCCHDLEQSRDVAVKVIRQEHVSEAWMARLFHSEVLAMAKLAHPNVIPIYDFADEEGLGSFFVMEYRPGRPLSKLLNAPPPWPVLRELFDAILDALAYAHSKNVLHLDIKPDNVLVSTRPDGRLHPTVLDFGIARIRMPGEGITHWKGSEGTVLGTVAYMAPEQASADLGRFGRWTDLYALGTMLYELVAGRLPFGGATPVAQLTARIIQPAPHLFPREGYDIPDALPAAVAELLQTQPWQRPRFAADARALLRAIGREEEEEVGSARTGPARELVVEKLPLPPGAPRVTADLMAAWLRQTPPPEGAPMADADIAKLDTAEGATPDVGQLALARAHTLLADSRALHEAAASSMTRLGPPSGTPSSKAEPAAPGPVDPDGATGTVDVPAPASPAPRTGATGSRGSARASGLITGAASGMVGDARSELGLYAEPEPPPAGAYGLYGLRDLPVLGRFMQRQACWQEVRRAFGDGLPRLVILEGDAGVGKSRLARDVVERGEQLGLLEGMQSWWSAQPQADEGLRGLVENVLDTRGADAIALIERIDFWLQGIPGDHELFERDVRLFLRPAPDAPFDKNLAYRVATEIIEKACTRRPVLLWLDDLQWGGEQALTFVRRLLARDPVLPVCVIGTVRSGEEVPEGWDDLLAAERVRSVRLEKLDGAATRSFVRGLLDVDENLAGVLVERAEGNPLFAAQLLHQLVEADALERVGGHYQLSRAFDLDAIPANIGALWERRLAATFPEADLREALLPFAVARPRVSAELLRSLRDAVAAADPEGELFARFESALRRARAAGLVVEEEGALRFTHGLLRDHVLGGVKEDARAGLHGLAADALSPLAEAGEDCQWERAEHLRVAERDEECVEAARAAIGYSRARGETAQIEMRSEGLLAWTEAGAPQVGQSRAYALVQLARLSEERGQLDEADARLDTAATATGRSQDPGILERRAMILRKRGRYDQAIVSYEAMLAGAEEEGDAETAARALWGKAESLRRTGHADEAPALYEAALTRCDTAGDERLAARVRRSMGLVRLDAGDAEGARRDFEAARDVFQRIGDANGEMLVESALGAWFESRGDYLGATPHQQRVLAIARRLELAYFAAFAHVNLAILKAKVDDPIAVREHLDSAEEIDGGLRAKDARTVHAYLKVELEASARNHPRARVQLASAVTLRDESGFVDIELPLCLERALGRLIGAGAEIDAFRAALLAEVCRLWNLLGESGKAERATATFAQSAS